MDVNMVVGGQVNSENSSLPGTVFRVQSASLKCACFYPKVTNSFLTSRLLSSTIKDLVFFSC